MLRSRFIVRRYSSAVLAMAMCLFVSALLVSEFIKTVKQIKMLFLV